MAFTAGRGQATIFQSANGWEDEVLNDIAGDAKVRAGVTAQAEKIAGAAKANVSNMAGTADARGLANGRNGKPGVKDMIGVKPIKEYERVLFHKGTRIPVALVFSDSKYSQWLEYGHGHRLPAMRFMLAAARSVGGGKWIPRGRSKGAR